MKLLSKLGLILTFFTFSHITNAQINKCATVEMDSILRASNPSLPSKAEFEAWMANEVAQGANSKIIGGVYYIPVVFHVIHNGEAVGTGTNVSFAAVQSQIDVLNEDFRRILGTNGYNTNPVGADTQIEFCLAQRRPDGSAFPAGQPGVNRINRSTAGFTPPPFNTAYIDTDIKTWTYNGNVPTATRGWDPNKYMNIWLCDIAGGTLGYAQFPQTPLGGMGCGAQSAATDGVVFTYESIGKSVVTGFGGPYAEGRTATHEVGHWLGLRHIWGDGGCGVDDFCNDTPLSDNPNYGCSATNSCTDPAPDPSDMIQNYMDYTDDLCMNIFTQDQKIRMRTVLTSSPLRLSLINSDACTPPNPSDASIVDVLNPTGDNCPGAITPTAILRNRGGNNLTSATIAYSIDNGPVTNFSWTGNVAPSAQTTVTLAPFTSLLGVHTIKVYSILPNGITDPSPIYDTVQLSFSISNGINPNYVQDFETQNFPPDVKWTDINGGNNCFRWVGASAVSSTGVSNNNTAQFPAFGNGSTSTDELITPIFILPCNASAATLTFDLSHRRRTTGTSEQLFVDISTDCGLTWNATPIYSQSGAGLATVTGTQGSAFYPTSAAQWRNESINLLPFVQATSRNIKFRFRAIANNGNNVYIDNVTFNATTAAEINVTQSGTDILDGGFYNYGTVTVGVNNTAVFTVTNNGASNLTLSGPINVSGTGFTLQSTFGLTTLAPGASTTFSITFNTASPGNFTGNVSFGTNDCDEGTFNFTLQGQTSSTPPTADFSATPLTICEGSTVAFTNLSSGATSYSWNFGPGAVPATSTLANPSVVFNNPGLNTISLIATNAFGSDTETKVDFISVVSNTGGTLPLVEGFTGTFAPAGWNIVNNGGTTTWQASTAGVAPTAGNSMRFNNYDFNDQPFQDEARVPGLNLNGFTSATLTFDVAYAPYDATYFDGLEVLISTDCEQTFTSIYNKSNTVLATAPAQNTLFVPTAAQWRNESIDLTPYIGNSKAVIAFRSLAGWGNALYVDNVNISGVTSTLPLASFTANPTTICAGQTVTYTNTSTGSPTSYAWTFPGGTPATSTATNPTVTYATAGTYSATLIATNGSGSNTSTQNNAITVNAAPATPGTITGTATVCANQTGVAFNIANVAGATSYTWTVPSGATVATGQGSNSITVNFGTTGGNVSVTATNSCGTSAANTFAVSVNSIPATPGTITGTATVCPNQTGVAFSIANISGATSYTWTVPSGATVATGQGSNAITVNFGATGGNVSVTATNSCGTSAANTFTVSLNSIPATPGTITGTASVCANQTGVAFSIANVSGATSYTWTVPSGATVATGQGSNAITVNFGSTGGNVSVTATNSCGTSSANTFAISVNSTPATPGAITGSIAVCPSSNGNTYSIASVSGATNYTWTVPSGAVIASGQGTNTISVDFGVNGGNITVNASNSCGTSSTSSLPVTISSAIPATPGSISGNQNVCENSISGNYSVSLVSGATNYTWTVPAGASITSGQGTNAIVVDFGTSSGNITVNASSSCGTSGISSTPITVNSIPATPVITVLDNCGNSLLSSNATGTILWSTGETTSAITVTSAGSYSVTSTVNGCTSSPGSNIAAPIAIPATPNISVADNCGNSVLSSDAVGTILWSTGESTSAITVNSSGNYTVTSTENGCTSPAGTAFANPAVIPNAPVVTVTNNCGNSILVSDVGANIVWSTGATTQNITVVNAGNYTVTQTVGACTSSAGTGVAAPLIIPTVTFAPLADICVNADPITLIEGSPAGGTYSGTGVSGNTFTPSTAGAGTFILTYVFTDANGCSGNATQDINVGCLGLDVTDLKDQVLIYPNPATSNFTIKVNSGNLTNINIFDAAGRLVQSMQTTGQKVNVDVSTYASGTYQLELQFENELVRERITITK